MYIDVNSFVSFITPFVKNALSGAAGNLLSDGMKSVGRTVGERAFEEKYTFEEKYKNAEVLRLFLEEYEATMEFIEAVKDLQEKYREQLATPEVKANMELQTIYREKIANLEAEVNLKLRELELDYRDAQERAHAMGWDY